MSAYASARDYRAEGDDLWDRFTNKTIADQLWYYRELVEFFGTRQPGPLLEDLQRAVSELEQLADLTLRTTHSLPQPVS